MNFTVGLSQIKYDFTDCIIKNKNRIDEVYFSYPGIQNGRMTQEALSDKPLFEQLNFVHESLKVLSDSGLKLNLLLNATCYGKDSLSRAFFEKIGNCTDGLLSSFNLTSVTTASPIIAKFIKNNFKSIEVRASVNMEIGTTESMDYIKNYYDSFYVRRELNRDFNALKTLKKWADENEKKLFGLANSGCLNYCSAHVFHDNLVSHEKEIAAMDNAYEFTGICREYLKSDENYASLYDKMNFIRPEDVCMYDPFFESLKLATRVHNHPSYVLESYINQKYSGDLLKLLEPEHSIYPYVIENGNPPMLKNILNSGR